MLSSLESPPESGLETQQTVTSSERIPETLSYPILNSPSLNTASVNFRSSVMMYVSRKHVTTGYIVTETGEVAHEGQSACPSHRLEEKKSLM